MFFNVDMKITIPNAYIIADVTRRVDSCRKGTKWTVMESLSWLPTSTNLHMANPFALVSMEKNIWVPFGPWYPSPNQLSSECSVDWSLNDVLLLYVFLLLVIQIASHPWEATFVSFVSMTLVCLTTFVHNSTSELLSCRPVSVPVIDFHQLGMESS